VDGLAGMSSQGQANANLYMGVTTVVARNDSRHGIVDFFANPSPHLYLVDSIGTTDNWSLLAKHPEWALKLRQGARPMELSPEDTSRQLVDTARLGTRVLWLGPNLTAANTQWIIAQAHRMGLVTYGEFVSTPYRVGIEAGVDALPEMGRYELGVIPTSYRSRWWKTRQGRCKHGLRLRGAAAAHRPSPTRICRLSGRAPCRVDAHSQHLLRGIAWASKPVEGTCRRAA